MTSTTMHPITTDFGAHGLASNDQALHELLQAWTTNDDLRRSGGSFPQRVESRRRLDSARLTVARARRIDTRFMAA